MNQAKRENKSAIKRAITQTADAVISAVKAMLGVRSPSKDTYYRWERFIAQQKHKE